ncbi:MAG: hypothetical protein IJ864_00065 [Alphaproteobacteria bacterium]|nr:hypothetical protein [Alphaproteobacteria bacterium]
MAEFKDRSFIFKFFYVLLVILTFPIFLVLQIIRHPLWTLVVLLLCFILGLYYPLTHGVKSDQLLKWYQDKYFAARQAVVTKAVDNGMKDFVPATVLNEVKNQQEEQLDAEQGVSENYNNKIVRDATDKETKMKLKQRSGFKRRSSPASSGNTDVDVLTQNGEKAGGLSALLEKSKVGEDVRRDQPELVAPSGVKAKPAEDVSDDAELELFKN